MFVAKPEGELTQVDFWNLYKDIFVPYQDQYHLLVASDVIKNVNVVFPQAQAMVLPGPPQKFVVRGVDRRKDDRSNERFKCQWNRSECDTSPFGSAGELCEHILEHISSVENDGFSCLWATCSREPLPKPDLRAHVLPDGSIRRETRDRTGGPKSLAGRAAIVSQVAFPLREKSALSSF